MVVVVQERSFVQQAQQGTSRGTHIPRPPRLVSFLGIVEDFRCVTTQKGKTTCTRKFKEKDTFGPKSNMTNFASVIYSCTMTHSSVTMVVCTSHHLWQLSGVAVSPPLSRLWSKTFIKMAPSHTRYVPLEGKRQQSRVDNGDLTWLTWL